jgi:DNA-binding MurR/RpiR family transcriptional regulator
MTTTVTRMFKSFGFFGFSRVAERIETDPYR